MQRSLATITPTTMQAKQATDPDYLSLDEAASYLKTSISTLREWVRTKGVPYYKPGKLLLFRQRDLAQWMNGYRKGKRGLELSGYNDQRRR